MITPAQQLKRLEVAKVLCILDGEDLILLSEALRHYYEHNDGKVREEEQRLLCEMTAGVQLAQVRQWRDRLTGENG